MKILLVDDDKAICEAIGLTLEEHEVVCLEDGRKTIEIMEQINPHLVLCDAWMSYSGLEVCDEIKGHPKLSGTPIIMLTAANIISKPDCVDEILYKPFEIKDLITIVNRYNFT